MKPVFGSYINTPMNEERRVFANYHQSIYTFFFLRHEKGPSFDQIITYDEKWVLYDDPKLKNRKSG